MLVFSMNLTYDPHLTSTEVLSRWYQDIMSTALGQYISLHIHGWIDNLRQNIPPAQLLLVQE